MKKKIVLYVIISCIITLVPMLVGLILWDALPDRIATSFDVDGSSNDYSSKLFAVVGLPLILVGINLLCILLTLADPKRRQIGTKLILFTLSIVPATSLFCGCLMYQNYFGLSLNVTKFSFVFLGLLLFVCGFAIRKCKQNYTIGIKLPWTLESKENWDKTHAFGGKLWIVGGVFIILLGLLGFTILPFCVMGAVIIIPTIYSYLYYRKNEKNEI